MSEDPTKHMSNEDLRLILTRLDSIDTRLMKLEDKVDQRLKETRPIWEQVLTRLGGLETEMRNGFRKLERQVGLLAEDVMIVRADHRDLEKRLTKIESEPAQ
ncbi:MAG TPA: hypothetical protein VF779_07560 [Pyrinomonadaceae bacterium]